MNTFPLPVPRLLAGLLLATAALFATAAQTTPAAPVAAVEYAPAEMREVELTYPAEAVAESARQAVIAAQMTGRVVEARFDAGARFKAGETLMRLDVREAQHGLAGAQAQLANARAQLERTRNLFAQKFVSQAALDKAEADYKAASAAAGQADVAGSHGNIVAPFAGTVAQRLIEPGEMATPGRPLLSVFDPQTLRVVADIPQSRQEAVRRMLRARIEIPGTGEWVDATRVEVLPTADETTHSVRVRASLPAAASVLPGMFAHVRFAIGKAKKLVIPAGAVLRRGELTGVYVADAKNADAPPTLRQVRVGEPVGDGMTEVLAGLSAGERVALDPVRAGFAVQRTPASR